MSTSKSCSSPKSEAVVRPACAARGPNASSPQRFGAWWKTYSLSRVGCSSAGPFRRAHDSPRRWLRSTIRTKRIYNFRNVDYYIMGFSPGSLGCFPTADSLRGLSQYRRIWGFRKHIVQRSAQQENIPPKRSHRRHKRVRPGLEARPKDFGTFSTRSVYLTTDQSLDHGDATNCHHL